jgi:hypothetical protein
MMDLDAVDALLSAAGITNLPPDVSKWTLAGKIIADNLVNLRVQELVASERATEAVGKFHPIEKQALRRRLGLIEESTDKPRVLWGIGPHPTSGKIIITAVCGSETMNWSGAVEDLACLKFRGETCPADIATVYKLSTSSGPDPELEAVRRDYAAREQAKKNQAAYEAKTRGIRG